MTDNIKESSMLDVAFIQVLDISGNWRTIGQVPNQSQMIAFEMENQKRQFPSSRIRAVDALGRLIDILM